jgi:hypothetical protein
VVTPARRACPVDFHLPVLLRKSGHTFYITSPMNMKVVLGDLSKAVLTHHTLKNTAGSR